MQSFWGPTQIHQKLLVGRNSILKLPGPQIGHLPRTPNVAPLRALWSLLDGIWGVLKGSWGMLVIRSDGAPWDITWALKLKPSILSGFQDTNTRHPPNTIITIPTTDISNTLYLDQPKAPRPCSPGPRYTNMQYTPKHDTESK